MEARMANQNLRGNRTRCPHCGGGRSLRSECLVCHGRGTVPLEETKIAAKQAGPQIDGGE